MVLEREIKAELNEYLKLLEGDVVIAVQVGDDVVSRNMLALAEEIAELSSLVKVEETSELERTPSFRIAKLGSKTGVVFAGIPLGHEFSSLVLALLQASGRAPKIEAELIERIEALSDTSDFVSYINLSCHICPEVVQALNVMSILNPKITHTMVDGTVFQAEVEAKDILAVPTVYCNGEFFCSGRISLEEIVAKLSKDEAIPAAVTSKEPFDMVVVGGGPAGISAAIYGARKGIRIGIVTEQLGGQIKDTFGIENFIGTNYTEGPKLAADLEEHVKQYPINIIRRQQVQQLIPGDLVELELASGTSLRSKTVIVATGARWRTIGVPGELEFKNKGVAYCPHCDGPVFKGKRVAVIGGGNSGIEAAIDLAGIVEHVTVLEFLPELKADSVLQQRLKQLSNVTVLTNVQTQEITGTNRVDGLVYTDRTNGASTRLDLQGVFILVGLIPNTEWLQGVVACNKHGEIIVDGQGTTNIPGVFAAGDCTNSHYKQIIIAMGSGATAALGAFDHLIRKG